MKKLLFALVLSFAVCVGANAQDTQVSASFVLKEQTRLGYEAHSVGVKIEGVYKFNDQWAVVAYATGLKSPKIDSGTGKSGFLSIGARWSPIKYKGVRFFGEFDGILGALVTDPYRKTVFHFRNAIGVKLLDGRLILDVARLYQDILPDAAKLLSEQNRAALHTAFNQLSAWDYEGYYWSEPLKEGGKVGLRTGIRHSRSQFVTGLDGDKRTGWLLQFEIGPYWRF